MKVYYFFKSTSRQTPTLLYNVKVAQGLRRSSPIVSNAHDNENEHEHEDFHRA